MSNCQRSQLARAATGITPSGFLFRSVAFGAGALPPLGGFTPASAEGEDDADILNVLLSLEFVQVALFEAAIDRLDLPPSLRRLAERTGDDDQQHVRALKNLVRDVGANPAKQGVIRFSSLEDRESFLSLAVQLKELSVSAYAGALPSLSSGLAIGSIASMLQVEGHHAACIRMAGGRPPAPSAFGASLSPERVQQRLGEYRR